MLHGASYGKFDFNRRRRGVPCHCQRNGNCALSMQLKKNFGDEIETLVERRWLNGGRRISLGVRHGRYYARKRPGVKK